LAQRPKTRRRGGSRTKMAKMAAGLRSNLRILWSSSA